MNIVFRSIILAGCILPLRNTQVCAQTKGGDTHAMHAAEWKPIAEKNVVWKKRVWREIDANESRNSPMRYQQGGDHGDNLLQVIMDAVRDQRLKAYSAKNDQFTEELTAAEAKAIDAPRKIMTRTVNAETGKVDTVAGLQQFDKGMVYKYRLKEDWIFDKTQNKSVVRIVGLAPLRAVLTDDGSMTYEPMFWIYYPDARALLEKSKVYYSISDDALNWYDFFEGRMFGSSVVKISDPAGAK